MSNIDIQLKQEYEKFLEFLRQPKFKDVDFTNPLLINYDSEKYKNYEKIMIFGQETFDWGKKFCIENENSTIKNMLDTYEKFYFEEGFKDWGGAFWNEFKALRDEYKKNYEDKTVFIWNNILKLGKVEEKGRLNDKIIDLFINYEIIQKEISIIKPSKIVFYTGPYYDNYIRRVFRYVRFKEVEGFEEVTLSEIYLEELDINCIRTYHPGYLNRMKDEKFEIRNRILKFLSEKS